MHCRWSLHPLDAGSTPSFIPNNQNCLQTLASATRRQRSFCWKTTALKGIGCKPGKRQRSWVDSGWEAKGGVIQPRGMLAGGRVRLPGSPPWETQFRSESFLHFSREESQSFKSVSEAEGKALSYRGNRRASTCLKAL